MMFYMYRDLLIYQLHVTAFLVGLPTEPTLDVGCESNADCPDYTACENRQCINPCAIRDPCAPSAICKVVRHEPVCTCPDGYIGNPQTSCELRKYPLIKTIIQKPYSFLNEKL